MQIDTQGSASQSAVSYSIIIFILLITLVAGVIMLQIFLSKMRNKWLGLILPFISFFFSIIVILNIATYSNFSQMELVAMDNGEAISTVSEVVVEDTAQKNNSSSTIFTVGYVFVLCNIPTVVLMGIYFGCREKLKRNDEIQKMNILDL